jgi:hypothetical protein
MDREVICVTGLAYKSPTAGRRQNTVLAVIGVTAATRIVRDRRTYERVILLAIALAAAAGIARAGQARSMARLIAWDRRQTLAEQRRAEASRS